MPLHPSMYHTEHLELTVALQGHVYAPQAAEQWLRAALKRRTCQA